MTVRIESSKASGFTTSRLPWLLAGAILIIFLATRDPWISPESLYAAASLSGLTWLTELHTPVTWLVTYPVRWLPAGRVPLALNSLTAIFAALTLAQLARSVALLPHDRTRLERQRNSNKSGLLASKSSWLPPVFAVLLGGLQITFWEHATAGLGEMFDLLLFAFGTRCLLEFRIARGESWLMRLAFVLGLAVANNWAMIAFLSLFLLALLWMKGAFRFFSPRYVAQFLDENAGQFNFRLPIKMLALWLAGASLFLLPPLARAVSPQHLVAFWPALRYSIFEHYRLLSSFRPQMIFFLGLSSVLPLLVMGIRWGRLIEQSNAWANSATTLLFHFVHGFLLALCVWAMLGSPFSPRQIQPLFPCLPLYYLTALNAGYYCGYFLLVFGPRTTKSRQEIGGFAHTVSIGAMGALALFATAVLAERNLLVILRERDHLLSDYFDQVQKCLPNGHAAVLSEDAARLQYLEARLIRDGRQKNFALIDTVLLAQHPGYREFLAVKYPNFKLELPAGVANSQITNPPVLTRWLLDLSRSNEIYFMHPCAGYISEKFFSRQRGLLYQLQPYPTNAVFVPPLPAELMAENQSFCTTLAEEEFPKILPRAQTPYVSAQRDWASRILRALRAPVEMDRRARLAGQYYALAVNSCGVDLQTAGRMNEAGRLFQKARQLNPDNVTALMNLQCNQDLQANKRLTIDVAERVEEKFGRGRNWDQVLRQDGPADEPNACYRLGGLCAGLRMYRQAIQQFQRAQALAPDSTNAPLKLAELFLQIGDFHHSLAEAGVVLNIAPENLRALILKEVSLVQLRQFDEAIGPLSTAVTLQATNTDARIVRAIAFAKMDKASAAKEDYERVVSLLPKAYPAYFGLAEIAYQTKDFPTAIRNCELYLMNAPAGLPEEKAVRQWLKELKPATEGR